MTTTPVSAQLLRRFNRPDAKIYRAYDHLIAARIGMTLMVPVAATSGVLDDLIDRCPVPWLEATTIIAADYASAEPLELFSLVHQMQQVPVRAGMALFAQFSRELLEAFAGQDGIFLHDRQWRHTRIHLSTGGQECRVLMGEAGLRLAFTPDFLAGVL